MTPEAIASKLYRYYVQGKFELAQQELCSKVVYRIDVYVDGDSQIVIGIEALIEKYNSFFNSFDEVHERCIREPKVYGNNIFMETEWVATKKGKDRQTYKAMHIFNVIEKIVSEKVFHQ